MGSQRTVEEANTSHQPGVSALGCLFIFCDVSFIRAKVQTHWQISCLIPHSKPSLRDARWPDSQTRGQGEGRAVGMPLVRCTVLYKCRGPMHSTAVDEEVLTLLTIWRREQQGLGKVQRMFLDTKSFRGHPALTSLRLNAVLQVTRGRE